MKKVVVVIEVAKDGGFSCYTREQFDGYALLGYGASAKEAKEDFLSFYKDVKGEEEDLSFTFEYDVKSFFDYFDFLKISKVAELAGINPSLMRRYVSGCANIGESQYNKILMAVRRMSEDLHAVAFTQKADL